MKATKKAWKGATDNLRARQQKAQHTDDNRTAPNVLRDYTTHLNKCGYGNSILDVGCGGQFLKTCIPEDIEYIGLDAFPIKGVPTLKGSIETIEGIEVDTVCCMAVLDNCLDFDKAIENIKKIAKKNVIILTGIDIEVDEYHTFKLQLSDFHDRFKDWNQTHYEELTPKVWLLCYTR
jgi:2-polyprenyl-3-methyl-5-hydroxy-6-metoxy-1,4-benzoquinol methylase